MQQVHVNMWFSPWGDFLITDKIKCVVWSLHQGTDLFHVWQIARPQKGTIYHERGAAVVLIRRGLLSEKRSPEQDENLEVRYLIDNELWLRDWRAKRSTWGPQQVFRDTKIFELVKGLENTRAIFACNIEAMMEIQLFDIRCPLWWYYSVLAFRKINVTERTYFEHALSEALWKP